MDTLNRAVRSDVHVGPITNEGNAGPAERVNTK